MTNSVLRTAGVFSVVLKHLQGSFLAKSCVANTD